MRLAVLCLQQIAIYFAVVVLGQTLQDIDPAWNLKDT
jgi:hypothetical protein